MTEYKKLVALCDLLAKDVTGLISLLGLNEEDIKNRNEDAAATAVPKAAVDPEQLFATSSRIRQSIIDGCPRIRKMVLKARETDPNRQIYNETMCGKIEELFKSFCGALKQLSPSSLSGQDDAASGPLPIEEATNDLFDAVLEPEFDVGAILEQSQALQTTEDIYNEYIMKRAKEEAWQSRVAQGLSDVVTFEGQQRSLITAEERASRTALAEEKRSDKMRVICLLEEREAAKWNAELMRRAAEQRALEERTAKIEVIANVPTALQDAIPEVALRRKLVAHVRELIMALLRTPEDMNIRRLRNNNEHLLCDYGHPCLTAIGNSGQGPCACAAVTSAAEMLWHRMGYSIRYTSTPNRSVESARLEKRAEALFLPCRQSLAMHIYTPMGFEDYSERFLELLEPNAMEKPDEWMVWYNMMQEMEQVLTNMLSA